MIPQTFDYTAPSTLDQALGLIAQGAKPLAGGMSLIPMMKLRLASPEHLVDIGRLPELRYIRDDAGVLRLGAGCTHYEVETSPLLRGKCPLLSETAARIGDVQVRNMGTIGGSVAHADPAADYPAALLALEAQIVLRGAKSQRTVAASGFFLDTFATALEPGEIVSEIIVPVEDAGAGTSYQKMAQPASGFALVGVAARLRRSGGTIVLARLGVTGLAPHAYRAASAEKALEGTPGTAADIQMAASRIAEGVEANADLHASADYRRHLAAVSAARAITAALARTA